MILYYNPISVSQAEQIIYIDRTGVLVNSENVPVPLCVCFLFCFMYLFILWVMDVVNTV